MSTPSYRSDFRVAIICALPEEKEAVVAVMDRMYSEEDIYIPGHVNDTNTYTYGQLGGQPVALCTLQDAGTRTAAQAIAKMEVSFLKLTIIFVVGIAGGAPFDREGTSTGIRLGDVVVSNAIYQHDLAKQNEDGVEIITDNDRQLPQLRGKAAAWIKHLSPKDIARIAKNTNIDFVLYGDLLAEKYTQPALDTDRIYDRTRRHKHRSGCSLCAQATETTGTVCSTVHNEACSAINCKPEPMPPRTRTGTEIFIGPYVSGSQVIKSAQHRAKLVELFGALALEMEGAGSCGEYPILIVKGIVDYADSHKNKRWRLYPAAMAALCTRAIIQDMQLGSGTY
ncbi:hypothetical protein KVT40_006579 [Elsinoe batatas]|uniref:Nucleoside phosphorylase domain-containing protein n=1 Tax=Elsinoe batatas TaxID=2601811 RepID=A0A8K0L0W9_9PEZI|nr:hypothetical protein KVT40_006579 [Elsinoe batatas]